jgi:hypothetical protein
MTFSNARLIEKDVLASSALLDTQSGSAVVDLFSWNGGASRFSCQAIYDVTAVPAAAVIATANIFISSDPDHPSQFNKTAHGFTTGLKVQATTAGTLAVPLALATDYYAIRIDANYFQLASSLANAIAGTPIAITNVGVTSTTLTPVALSASVTFQESNDGVNYTDMQAATSITTDGSTIIKSIAYCRYFKVLKTLTAGVVNLKAYVLVIGDAS